MERFGVPKNIVGFVLPTGYSFNLDGTTLYLSLASVFVAQLAGVPLTFGQQLVMMLTLMLTSKGVAGVPRAALVVLTATLTQFGLPLEGAAILLGIDQIMDMGRTAVNVMGNCIATAVVARWEGVFDDERMRAFAAAARPRPPDADRGGRRARPARRRGRPRVRGGATRSSRSTAPTLDVTDDAAVARGDRARAARRDRQLRGLQRRRRAPRIIRSRRCNVNAFAVRALARAARDARRGAGALQQRFRLRRHARRRRTRKTIAPNPRSVYAASKLLGEWFALDAPRALRAARREPVRPRARRPRRRRAASRRSSTRCWPGSAPRVFEDRTVSPTYVVDAARATRQLLERRRRPASITA